MSIQSLRRASSLLLGCLLAGAVQACVSTLTISDILRQGDRANGRRVQVAGDVVSVERGDTALYVYEIEDGTGRISVESEHAPAPSPCERVVVRGRVVSVFGNLTNSGRPGVVQGRWWLGLSVVEQTRQSLGLSTWAQSFGCKQPP